MVIAYQTRFFDQGSMRKVRLLVLRTGTLFFCLT
jgi:hypothetical protein